MELSQGIKFWQETTAEEWFIQPLQEIINDLAEENYEKFPDQCKFRDDCKPASIGKNHLYDLLVERRPDLFDRFDPKTIKACIFVAMEKIGYHSHSRRKKCFWREGL